MAEVNGVELSQTRKKKNNNNKEGDKKKASKKEGKRKEREIQREMDRCLSSVCVCM